MTIHELKIFPEYFMAVEEGIKTFEYRLNDRGFQKGDKVCLKEYNPKQLVEGLRYTGNELTFIIGYVLPVSATHVVFSLLERVK